MIEVREGSAAKSFSPKRCGRGKSKHLLAFEVVLAEGVGESVECCVIGFPHCVGVGTFDLAVCIRRAV